MLYTQIDQLAEHLEARTNILLAPHYNLGPALDMALPPGSRWHARAVALRCSLAPYWSKGTDRRYSRINARAETVHDKLA